MNQSPLPATSPVPYGVQPPSKATHHLSRGESGVVSGHWHCAWEAGLAKCHD